MILLCTLSTMAELHMPLWLQYTAAAVEFIVLGILTKTSFSIKRRTGRIEWSVRINQGTADRTPVPYPPESPTNPGIKLPVTQPPEVK